MKYKAAETASRYWKRLQRDHAKAGKDRSASRKKRRGAEARMEKLRINGRIELVGSPREFARLVEASMGKDAADYVVGLSESRYEELAESIADILDDAGSSIIRKLHESKTV